MTKTEQKQIDAINDMTNIILKLRREKESLEETNNLKDIKIKTLEDVILTYQAEIKELENIILKLDSQNMKLRSKIEQ